MKKKKKIRRSRLPAEATAVFATGEAECDITTLRPAFKGRIKKEKILGYYKNICVKGVHLRDTTHYA